MPVLKCSNGKYRIGTGPCMYHSKELAEKAYKGYLGHKHAEGDMKINSQNKEMPYVDLIKEHEQLVKDLEGPAREYKEQKKELEEYKKEFDQLKEKVSKLELGASVVFSGRREGKTYGPAAS